MFRAWKRLYHSATFSTIENVGVGGTEFQLLLHAKALTEIGHQVSVAGVTDSDVIEQGVSFLGSADTNELKSKLISCADTQIVLSNQSEGMTELKAIMPRASIVQVCQNGPHFNADQYIDLYAFVGQGQFACYALKYPRRRHKFILLANVPPVNTLYSRVTPVERREQVIWVGSFEKQGFRRWSKAMAGVMRRHPSLRWVLCAPSYSRLLSEGGIPSMISDLDLPIDRIEIKNLPLLQLAAEIKRSQVMLASLGGEDGPTAYLDGHALGVPVLCGDDIIGKFSNPEGTGLRCTTAAECEAALEFLLNEPDLRKQMGELGERWIRSAGLTEEHQRAQLEHIISYVQFQPKRFPPKRSIQSDLKFPLRYKYERAEAKFIKQFRVRTLS